MLVCAVAALSGCSSSDDMSGKKKTTAAASGTVKAWAWATQ